MFIVIGLLFDGWVGCGWVLLFVCLFVCFGCLCCLVLIVVDWFDLLIDLFVGWLVWLVGIWV